MGNEHKISLLRILIYMTCTFYTASCEFNFSALVFDSCSHNAFCTFGNSSVSPGKYSCCADCSCSDDCYITNNCCPDAKVADRPYKGSCKTQSEHFDDHRPSVFSVDTADYSVSYVVVDTCDAGYDNDTVMRCLYPTALLDHMFVSDPDSRTIYKNRHCAACNGKHVYDEWQMAVVCKAGEAILTVEDREDYILSYCSLVSIPPKQSKESFDSFICAPDAVSKCNVSGEWDFYDQDLEQACEQYNMMYRYERVKGNRVVFMQNLKNIFCFLCNQPRGVKVHAECLTKIEIAPDRAPSSGLAPLTAVFDARREVVDNSKCGRTEIEDPLLGTCKPLSCPFGETTHFGNCVTDMQFMSVYLSVSYKIQYVIPEETANKDEILDEIAETVMNEAKLKILAASCGFCMTHLIDFTNLVIQSHTTEKCSFAKILQVFRFLSRSISKSVHPKFGKYGLTIRQIYAFPDAVDNDAPSYRILRGSRCYESLQLKPKFYCKRLTYSVSELSTRGVAKEMIDKLIKLSDPADDVADGAEQYVICINDYKLFASNAPRFLGEFFYVVVFGVMIQLFCNM